MPYRFEFKPFALRQFEKLPRKVQQRLALKLESLRDDPFPAGCKKLAGVEDTWRVRAGDYRIVYQVHGQQLVILVLAVGHRREVYR